MHLMLISHDRNTIRALKIALSKTTEDILPITSAYSGNRLFPSSKGTGGTDCLRRDMLE